MMRVMILTTAAVALVTLTAGAPAAWAGETSPPAAVGVPSLEQAAQAVMASSSASAPATWPGECAGLLEGRTGGDATTGCNFGAPSCSYGGQCDSWCFPLKGLCLSSCCACT